MKTPIWLTTVSDKAGELYGKAKLVVPTSVSFDWEAFSESKTAKLLATALVLGVCYGIYSIASTLPAPSKRPVPQIPSAAKSLPPPEAVVAVRPTVVAPVEPVVVPATAPVEVPVETKPWETAIEQPVAAPVEPKKVSNEKPRPARARRSAPVFADGVRLEKYFRD